jgi:hypothetical protein
MLWPSTLEQINSFTGFGHQLWPSLVHLIKAGDVEDPHCDLLPMLKNFYVRKVE